MKSLYFCILGLIFLLQQATGGWQEIRSPDESRSSLLEPLDDILQRYRQQIDEFEYKQSEVEVLKKQLSLRLAQEVPEKCHTAPVHLHAQLFGMWDMVACLNLTGDLKDLALMSLNATIFGANISQEIYDTVNNVMSKCQEKSFLKEMKCYYSSIVDLKDEILSLKRDVAPYTAWIKSIFDYTRKDFDHCVGIPYEIKGRLDRNIQSCMNGD